LPQSSVCVVALDSAFVGLFNPWPRKANLPRFQEEYLQVDSGSEYEDHTTVLVQAPVLCLSPWGPVSPECPWRALHPGLFLHHQPWPLPGDAPVSSIGPRCCIQRLVPHHPCLLWQLCAVCLAGCACARPLRALGNPWGGVPQVTPVTLPPSERGFLRSTARGPVQEVGL